MDYIKTIGLVEKSHKNNNNINNNNNNNNSIENNNNNNNNNDDIDIENACFYINDEIIHFLRKVVSILILTFSCFHVISIQLNSIQFIIIVIIDIVIVITHLCH